MFICDKCGLCCEKVGELSIYRSLDRGDGICMYFDEKTRLCSIYENRPVLCNIDKAYDEFFYDTMTRDKYYKMNYESCKKLKETLYKKG